MKLKLMGLVAMVSTGMSPCVSAAAEKVLHADMRPRPPDMTVDAKTGAGSGPLIEVLNEAAAAIGYTVEWRSAPFARSLEDMKIGAIDVVPRVVLTEERKAFSTFLGPIGAEPIEIKFLVGKGKEDALKSYEDLKKLTVGVKRGTVYFDRFDADTSIRREVGSDDANLVKMFAAGRFDAMIVLDKRSLEGALKEAGVVEYGWAAYKVPLKLEIFYAMPKASPQAAVAERLSAALQKMARSGRVIEIYKKHGVPPPE